ncbi:MAG: UDP-N-acetylglucosamine 2-epimerase [Candidatus Margulisiibacteriota bacterium]
MLKSNRKICVVTGSRAEYGILSGLMHAIKNDRELILQAVVAGMHLEPKFGLTYKEILKDGIKISAKVPMALNSDSDEAITHSVGLAVSGFGKVFKKLKPDVVVVLGDRFEILAASVAAMLFRIPIVHIHGGEITEGAYDDSIRHAITKMAYLHFVSHAEYGQRVIQMGEDPTRVFNFGAPGLDNLKKLKLLSKTELENQLGFTLGQDVALVTFHPVTLEKGSAKVQIDNLLLALSKSGMRIIFTMPNADNENDSIIRAIDKYIQSSHGLAKGFQSLGQLRYFSLMQHVGMMVGNSSSGIIEAASFRLPVVNVGDRQKGRLKPANVIDVAASWESILKGVAKAQSPQFIKSIAGLTNPFWHGNVSSKIKNKLKTYDFSNIKKRFIDLK